MSLPNYLAKIKSAGIYRFVWDKSQVPPQQAETLRLVVGYSEKGPFNTPVYIENLSDFKAIYGSSSKRLERRGVYFHRLAEQALQAGPILAFNIKPFKDETVKYISFNGSPVHNTSDGSVRPWTCIKGDMKVSDLYDTNRFWKLNEDVLPQKIKAVNNSNSYINIVATDIKDNSCSIFFKKSTPDAYKNITFRSWYNSQSLEYPEYMESILDDKMEEYFADVYVFKGEFTEEICKPGAALAKYFDVYRVAKEDESATHYYDETNKVYRSPQGNEVATHVVDIRLKEDYKNAFGESVDAIDYLINDSQSNFINVYSGITVPYFKDANGNYISLDLKFNADYNSHKILMKFDESYLEDNAASALKISKTDLHTKPEYLSGYTYTTIDKTTHIYAACTDILKTKGVRTALTNRVDVEYHYIVDTFDTGNNGKIYADDKAQIENKLELVAIAKEKDNAFAILNFPKMSKFVENENYQSDIEGVGFDIKKVAMNYPLPSESEGASYCAYYTQLVFTDGTVKQTIPSAALVSNLFMEKWNSRQPYYIVAGPTYGRITYTGLVGPDYNFGRSDLDVLEPMGVNAIIYVPRKGTYINSNQTAKQQPVSGLSKIHIRELVIYLQNEIEFLLQTYQWELNTQQLRDTIKSKADAICEVIKNNGGIYEYVNVCDETNNTPEVIDNEMIILNTEIEPARGAGKMVHQLTIHKTGALSSKVG